MCLGVSYIPNMYAYTYLPTHEQDRVDELSADNEKIKQKYTSHRRKLQRHKSEPRKLGSPAHSSSKLGEDRRARPKSGKRPGSASRRSATHLPPSSLALISENMDTDTSRQEVFNTSGLHTHIFSLQFILSSLICPLNSHFLRLHNTNTHPISDPSSPPLSPEYVQEEDRAEEDRMAMDGSEAEGSADQLTSSDEGLCAKSSECYTSTHTRSIL